MSKPTDAVSDGRGAPARVLQLPTALTAPVNNTQWRGGRYPAGVASLNKARNARLRRARLARAATASAALREAADENHPMEVDPLFVVAQARLIAAMAEKLVADIHAMQGEGEQ